MWDFTTRINRRRYQRGFAKSVWLRRKGRASSKFSRDSLGTTVHSFSRRPEAAVRRHPARSVVRKQCRLSGKANLVQTLIEETILDVTRCCLGVGSRGACS